MSHQPLLNPEDKFREFQRVIQSKLQAVNESIEQLDDILSAKDSYRQQQQVTRQETVQENRSEVSTQFNQLEKVKKELQNFVKTCRNGLIRKKSKLLLQKTKNQIYNAKQRFEILKEFQYNVNNTFTYQESEIRFDDPQVDVKFDSFLKSKNLRMRDTQTILKEILDERQEGFNEIEQAVVEIHEIQKEIAFKVHEQDEPINQIVENAENANFNVEKANKELGQAVVYQKERMKCTTGCVIAILIIVALLALAIYFLYFRKSSNATTVSPAATSNSTTSNSTKFI